MKHLMDKILSIPEEKLLLARCYDNGEQRIRVSSDFHITQKYENSKGVVLTLENKTYGMLIRLRFERDGEACRVTVDPGWIIEYKAIAYRLMELSILPEMLQTNVGGKGNYLIPLSSGFLADFRERPHFMTRTRIYMDQSEWEKLSIMNCFGCMAPKKNIFCVVDEGDFFCYTETEFNRDGKNDMRVVFQIRQKPGDMLRFEPMSFCIWDCGAKADYDDLAKIYRRWFMEKQGVALLRDRAKNNPTLDYSINALRVKIFLAQKYPYIPDGSSPVQVHTSFEQAAKIMDKMKAAGIDKATATIVGWNLGGHDGAYPTHFPIEPSVGGEQGLRKLIEHAKSIGYGIVPHDNWTDIYRNSPDFDYEYVARTEDQEPVAAGVWGGGQAYKACPLVQLRRFGFEFERVHQLGFQGHYYMDAQATAMWSCHATHHPANEKEFALGLSALTQIPRSIYGAVSVEGCSAYVIPFIDEASRISFDKYKGPEDVLDMRPIPFFHIALHGLIQYQAGGLESDQWQKVWLRSLAFGARPGMEVVWKRRDGVGCIGSNHDICIKRMAEPYQICFKKLKYQTQLMEALKEPVPGVYHVTYENGLSLSVNTTDSDVDGLKANSWKKNS